MNAIYFPALFLLALVLINRLGFIYVVNKRLKLSFSQNPVYTFLYFFLMTAMVAILFPHQAYLLFGRGDIIGPLTVLFVLVVVDPWVYARLKALDKLPVRLAKANPDQQFLLIDDRFLFSKTGDVIFQEVAVGTLLFILRDTGISTDTLVPLFALIFTLLHLHMFFSTKKMWAAYFSVCAAIAGFALPFIILTVPGGIYYATALHMLWYVESGALFGFAESSMRELRSA